MHFSWYLAHFKTKYNIYKQTITMMWHTGNSRKERRSAIDQPSSDSEQLNTDSDESDISEVESFQETFKTSSPDGPQLQEKENSNEIAVSPITAPNLQKVYVELQTVVPAMSSESDSPNSSPHLVHLEFSTDPSFPLSSDPSSYTTYSSTTSNKSTPTFPSGWSTSNSPTPVFPEDKFPPSDDESDDSLVDFDIDPKSENVNKKRAVLPGSQSSIQHFGTNDTAVFGKCQ